MNRYLLIVGAVLLAVALGIVGCEGASKPAPTPVTVSLNSSHSGQFGGLYAGDQNGTFAEQGLKVAFLEGGSKVDYITPVIDGRAQFGVMGADELILARAQGKPVRAIATILRRSSLAFGVLASSDITRPQDFAGHTIRVGPQVLATLHATTARVGVTKDQYTEVVLPSTVEAFKSGQADVWGMYTNSFAISLKNAGETLRFIYPDDYGVHFYSDTIFTTDQMIASNPDLVQRFLRATLSGYTFAVENPDKAGPMAIKYGPSLDASSPPRRWSPAYR